MNETVNCCAKQTDESSDCKSREQSKQTHFVPSFDVWKSDDRIVLRGDLPGVKPEDLDVRFENGSLHVLGTVFPREPAEGMVRREYSVGNFERHFSVGDNIDAEAIRASLRDGVVEIDLPFVPHTQPRKIEVQSA